MGTRFLPATKAVPKELLPIIDTPALQLIIDEAVGAGHRPHGGRHQPRQAGDRGLLRTRRPRWSPSCAARAATTMADRLERSAATCGSASPTRTTPLGLGHAVGCAREAVGDEPFAVLLPDEIMGDSVAAGPDDRRVRVHRRQRRGPEAGAARARSARYGVHRPGRRARRRRRDRDPRRWSRSRRSSRRAERPHHHRPLRAHPRRVRRDRAGAARQRRRDPAHRRAARCRPHAGPFHGVLSDIRRYDTGNPLGWLDGRGRARARRPAIGAPTSAHWLQRAL